MTTTITLTLHSHGIIQGDRMVPARRHGGNNNSGLSNTLARATEGWATLVAAGSGVWAALVLLRGFSVLG